ncbi:MAG: Crp/Fnr family transcriptional regulator [Desulfomonilia bacterium]|nr:Crp/Fnr family transcriptional regulator [Desulfomonilia bacterium]
MELRDHVLQADLFSGLPEDIISRLASRARVVSCAQGDLLFTEGQEGSAFFLLIEGALRLFKTSPSGQEISLKLVKPGEIFAEVILFENPSYPVNAMAITGARVMSFERSHVLGLLDEKEFRKEFIVNLMRKQRYLAERILYLTTYDVEERFFRFLIERYGHGGRYTVDMAKKDIASAIGTIPETFSRLIQRLKKQGMLQWEGNSLIIEKDYLDLFNDESGNS